MKGPNKANLLRVDKKTKQQLIVLQHCNYSMRTCYQCNIKSTDRNDIGHLIAILQVKTQNSKSISVMSIAQANLSLWVLLQIFSIGTPILLHLKQVQKKKVSDYTPSNIPTKQSLFGRRNTPMPQKSCQDEKHSRTTSFKTHFT